MDNIQNCFDEESEDEDDDAEGSEELEMWMIYRKKLKNNKSTKNKESKRFHFIANLLRCF